MKSYHIMIRKKSGLWILHKTLNNIYKQSTAIYWYNGLRAEGKDVRLIEVLE